MKVRVGLLGCGVVGGGVLRLLDENRDAIAARIGQPFEITKILVRDLAKERAREAPRGAFTTNPADIVANPEIDVVIEVMGGLDPARELVLAALSSKKQVVTANKMLLAVHGKELLHAAHQASADLAFEASVGGGIPVIRTLRDALVSDRVTALYGIVNGTSNFVLTRMQAEGLSFDAALALAQERGYAEADPTLDVDGGDAAHKLVVLAMLAFGASVPYDKVPTSGIRALEPIDHAQSARFGYVVKLLAIAREDHAHGGALDLRVHAALVRKDAPLANVSGVMNAIALEGQALGPSLLSGRGAGDLPTAVSVVADLVDVARAKVAGVAGLATRGIRLEERKMMSLDLVSCRHYLRFSVFDRPGVLAHITGALGRNGVSIEQLVQEGGGDARGAPVQVVLLTHVAEDGAVRNALAETDTQDFSAAPARHLRVHE